MVALNPITTEETVLTEDGNGYRFVAGPQALKVAPLCDRVGLDTDNDGNLDVRMTMAIEHEDANGDLIVNIGESVSVRPKGMDMLHAKASPYLSPALVRRALSRLANRLNGTL